MVILGIDPGYAITGFAFLDVEDEKLELLEYGVITTEKTSSHQERLVQTVNDLKFLINKHHPAEIAIEDLFFSKNTKTALKVAESRGAMFYALSELNLHITQYKPNQIKNNICGYGNAPKQQVQKMVQLTMELESIPQPDDAADAIAIALCHKNHLQGIEIS